MQPNCGINNIKCISLELVTAGPQVPVFGWECDVKQAIAVCTHWGPQLIWLSPPPRRYLVRAAPGGVPDRDELA
jgi:hypothetical protein